MNKKISDHFKKNDPKLYEYVLKVGEIKPIIKASSKDYFVRLCSDILGQQLSEKAGNAIIARFLSLFPGKVAPKKIVSIPHEVLRATGMSNSKAKYIRNLAEAVIKGELQIDSLDNLSDEEVSSQLIKVKGVGPWTAEMFLMFTLGRENVFSPGDLGLKKGLMKVHKLKKYPDKEKLDKIISLWSPYKTYASRVLWKSLEID